MSTEPGSEVLAAAFATVARVLSAASSADELLAQIATLAVTTIDSCEYAGVMATVDGRPVTVAVSDPIVTTLDHLQVQAGEGPCLEVLCGTTALYAADLADDDRWIGFGPRAVDAGVRSLLALRIGADESPGALNLYAQLPDAFAPTDRAQAAIFATHAGLAVANQRQRAQERNLADNLQQALTTRELIGQAQGILMERDRISSQEAFDVLRRASQLLNVKLREIAQQLVDTGQHPIRQDD